MNRIKIQPGEVRVLQRSHGCFHRRLYRWVGAIADKALDALLGGGAEFDVHANILPERAMATAGVRHMESITTCSSGERALPHAPRTFYSSS